MRVVDQSEGCGRSSSHVARVASVFATLASKKDWEAERLYTRASDRMERSLSTRTLSESAKHEVRCNVGQ